ncbi:hypothetical protein [Noviherbaspirillum pedocola]|uniref:Uncharacterized protein n=1 Tax=Noviherbaspirillum pedocola TaxID=2801341 RepID=A0A934T2J8_9BURK|nr:hypothetical protein [Noviherbaspirillum pedocola]MBK4736838.1 hypothetical protein [Noviherbaspirillum pedocola]
MDKLVSSRLSACFPEEFTDGSNLRLRGEDLLQFLPTSHAQQIQPAFPQFLWSSLLISLCAGVQAIDSVRLYFDAAKRAGMAERRLREGAQAIRA